MKKLYDMVVKVGTYTGKDGSDKGRYQNVGVMMEGDNGPFLLMAKTFNPAGVPGQDGKESILISLFAPKDKSGAQDNGIPDSDIPF